jgi:hypothetical protein
MFHLLIVTLTLTGCTAEPLPQDPAQRRDLIDHRIAASESALRQSDRQPRQNPDYQKLVFPQQEEIDELR